MATNNEKTNDKETIKECLPSFANLKDEYNNKKIRPEKYPRVLEDKIIKYADKEYFHCAKLIIDFLLYVAEQKQANGDIYWVQVKRLAHYAGIQRFKCSEMMERIKLIIREAYEDLVVVNKRNFGYAISFREDNKNFTESVKSVERSISHWRSAIKREIDAQDRVGLFCSEERKAINNFVIERLKNALKEVEGAQLDIKNVGIALAENYKVSSPAKDVDDGIYGNN